MRVSEMRKLNENPEFCVECGWVLKVEDTLVSEKEAGQEIVCAFCGQEYSVVYQRDNRDQPYEFAYALIVEKGDEEKAQLARDILSGGFKW